MFTEEEIWRFLKQILQACILFHENYIIHRDLKLNNIMIHNNIYKIGDPGIAYIFDQSNKKDYYIKQ